MDLWQFYLQTVIALLVLFVDLGQYYLWDSMYCLWIEMIRSTLVIFTFSIRLPVLEVQKNLYLSFLILFRINFFFLRHWYFHFNLLRHTICVRINDIQLCTLVMYFTVSFMSFFYRHYCTFQKSKCIFSLFFISFCL